MARQVTPNTLPQSDRIPPHSEEAERGVLGSVLLDSARVLDLCLQRRLRPESFYIPAHQKLYEAFVEMVTNGQAIDLVTTASRLREKGTLQEIGGTSYLDRLVDGTPTSAHAEHYIELVFQKHLLRRIIENSREAVDHCYRGEEDAHTVLDKTEQSFFDLSDDQRSTVVPWSDLIKNAMQEVEQIFQTKRGITGIQTGFADLDRVLQGLKNSDMIILAARPSMGKTALALNIAENVALGRGAPDREQRAVGVFSLEMSSEQLVRRMLCSHAEVESHKLSGGYVSAEIHGLLVQAAAVLSKAPIYLDDTAGLDIVELRARARRMKRKHDIKLIIVDYLQMLSCGQVSKNDGRQREVAAISGGMKAMAKELKVPVLVLSQLSRAPEQREGSVPKLSDLRESGSIEQDADVVWLLRRPCKSDDDERREDQTLAILNIAKNRNGPTKEIELNFIADYTRFEDRTHGVDQEPGFAAE